MDEAVQDEGGGGNIKIHVYVWMDGLMVFMQGEIGI